MTHPPWFASFGALALVACFLHGTCTVEATDGRCDTCTGATGAIATDKRSEQVGPGICGLLAALALTAPSSGFQVDLPVPRAAVPRAGGAPELLATVRDAVGVISLPDAPGKVPDSRNKTSILAPDDVVRDPVQGLFWAYNFAKQVLDSKGGAYNGKQLMQVTRGLWLQADIRPMSSLRPSSDVRWTQLLLPQEISKELWQGLLQFEKDFLPHVKFMADGYTEVCRFSAKHPEVMEYLFDLAKILDDIAKLHTGVKCGNMAVAARQVLSEEVVRCCVGEVLRMMMQRFAEVTCSDCE